MILDTLLRRVTARDFIDTYFHRVPFSEPGGARELVNLGSPETIRAILDSPDADILIAKEGDVHDGGRPDLAGLQRMQENGWTLVARHAEHHVESLAALAADFGRAFAAPINVHLYSTPSGRHGFGWHYDAEDVFIVQTAGRKTYTLRKNTVNPWPLEETLPRDMRFELEKTPSLECTLHAGDWLYLPVGWWHRADAGVNGEGDESETAVSLAIGVMSPAALDILELLRPRLASSPVWRQRLPVLGEAATADREELERRLAAVLEGLAADMRRELLDPDVRGGLMRALEEGGEDTRAPGG